ncbi:MAG: type II secretion system F family protein [Sedimentisphaerales bacterium]|nr:type II secretion system F family protein [Sedimentisphaerales bacterium]
MVVAQYNSVEGKTQPARSSSDSLARRLARPPVLSPDLLRRIRTKDICRFTRQLSTLLHAGMPLVPALSALVEQLEDATVPGDGDRIYEHAKPVTMRFRPQSNPLAKVVANLRDDVNDGLAFSDALAKYPDVFSKVFVSMVEAGQTGGALESTLLKLAEMLENKVRLAGKIKSVIAYPLMMAIVAVGVLIFLLSFVVPSITQIFLEMNRQLPWPTTLLIAICSFMRKYWLLFPLAACAGFFGIAACIRSEHGRMTWDRFKLRLPLFGILMLKLETARMTRTLAALLASGIPILRALDIVKGVVQNRFIAGVFNSVKESIGTGGGIAQAMGRTGLFPPIVLHTIATGQAGGTIENALTDIADMYDDEVEMASRTLLSLLEPAILLVMGAVIGFVVLAILLPIFDINQAI